MNPEAQRIALAESQGWTVHQIEVAGVPDIAILPPGVSVSDDLAVWKHAGIDLPDYLTDLNALHSAAKAECEKRGWNYSVWYLGGLYTATFYRYENGLPQRLGLAAGHDQCAALSEALLRALNLWTE